MDPIDVIDGEVSFLDRDDVDTDQIIPKQFLKSIKRTGFGGALFNDWRYLADGSPDPAFPLNQERFRDAPILVVRNNFGCGSSREHAVWAVRQAGFRVVLAPRLERNGQILRGFADIFAGNATKNGLLTVELPEPRVEEIFQFADRFPGLEATVDLDEQRIVLHLGEEVAFHFDLDATVKSHLMHGLDEIALTLEHAEAISAFESRHNTRMR